MATAQPVFHGAHCRCSDPISSSEELKAHQLSHYQYTAKPLGEILVEMELVSTDEIKKALSDQQTSHQRLGEILLQKGLLTRSQMLQSLCQRFGVPLLDLHKFDIDPEAVKELPANIARKYSVMPVMLDGSRLVVTVPDPTDTDLINVLRFITDRPLEFCIASPEDIAYAIGSHYGGQDVLTALEDLAVFVRDEPFHIDADSEQNLGNARPVVQLVQNLIADALVRHASDIHIRPGETMVDIYFRVDGVLQLVRNFSKKLLPAVVSRVKIVGNMDISEHRLPQDGRTRIHYLNKMVDLRLSIIPSIQGESVVIRILDSSFALRGLEDLGFGAADSDKLRHLLSQTHGVFLVTGPTGSGKSTTLYTALDHIKQSHVNIITVEDPVEYHVDGITQIQVNHTTGYDFPRALRHILRHDPDVIMVGEIRDQETAKMAVESALTGHLVLSTLHTNDAATTVTRLVEMGVEPYLVNGALIGVLAQRLVRCNCPHCLRPEAVDGSLRQVLGVSETEEFHRSVGCEHCHQTGVIGRRAVYELLQMTPELRNKVAAGASFDEIEGQAVRDGMTTLTESALQLAREKVISLAEVYRVRV